MDLIGHETTVLPWVESNPGRPHRSLHNEWNGMEWNGLDWTD